MKNGQGWLGIQKTVVVVSFNVGSAEVFRGPIDFKLSGGYSSRVLVEVKWSKNSKLLHGYETQLGEYEKAESTHHSLFLVIQVSKTDASVNRLLSAQGDALRDGKRAPEIRVIDGRVKDSASKFDPDQGLT